MYTPKLTHEQRHERRQQMAVAIASGKSVPEVAGQFGVSVQTVYDAAHGGGVKPIKRPKARWVSVDWSMRDVDIARLLNVSRERVRQVRRQNLTANSPLHKRHSSALRLRAWLQSRRDEVSQMTQTQVMGLVPFNVSSLTLRRTCEAIGITLGVRVLPEKLVTKDTVHEFVSVDPVTGCWEWNGSRNPETGYGQVNGGGAHRFVFQLFNGDIPKGKWVLHHCDNPPCVNPHHLYVGTAADNAHDRDSRGRNGLSSLNTSAVAEIRRAFRTREKTAAELAEQFGINRKTVYDIWKGRRYRNIAEEVA